MKDKEIKIPRGYRLVPELKSERVQLLMKPSTKAAIKEIAQKNDISMNELVETILEKYIESMV